MCEVMRWDATFRSFFSYSGKNTKSSTARIGVIQKMTGLFSRVSFIGTDECIRRTFQNVTLFHVTNVNVISFTLARTVQPSLWLFLRISQTLHSYMYTYLTHTITSVAQQMGKVWAEIYLQPLWKMWHSLRRFSWKSQDLNTVLRKSPLTTLFQLGQKWRN